jgi:hypothetical protein
MRYYLANGIYPEWSAFVKTVPHPTDGKKRYFIKCKRVQERILSRLLKCFRQGGELFVDRRMGGIESAYLIL